MKRYTTIKNVSIIIFVNLLLLSSIYFGYKIYKVSQDTKKTKIDYFTVNQIKYGLLDAENWTNQVNEILSMQVDSFKFSSENEALLKDEISGILNKLFTEADEMLDEKQKKVKDRVKYKVINAFVDVDKYRKRIPKFSQIIVEEIQKTKNKDKVKGLLKEKVSDVLCSSNNPIFSKKDSLLQKYSCTDIEKFNAKMNDHFHINENEINQMGYILIVNMVLLILLWVGVLYFKIEKIFTALFIYSVIISLVNLFIGVNLPMIEIDARISELNLSLLKSHIIFKEQIIFYQSKSIYDVVHVLMTTGKFDAIFVGVLIFLFSVIFPISKLISSILYLFRKEKAGRFIKFMAFKSGKWSMADVMVVAIFMAYIGFQGILESQLQKIHINSDTVNVLTTNKSNLQMGFLLFVSFVLCNLILSEILKRITNKSENDFRLKNLTSYRIRFVKN